MARNRSRDPSDLGFFSLELKVLLNPKRGFNKSHDARNAVHLYWGLT